MATGTLLINGALTTGGGTLTVNSGGTLENDIAAGTEPQWRSAYRQAAPPEQMYAGLSRYWRKRAEALPPPVQKRQLLLGREVIQVDLRVRHDSFSPASSSASNAGRPFARPTEWWNLR